MKRLTDKYGQCLKALEYEGECQYTEHCDTCDIVFKMMCKLAKYENAEEEGILYIMPEPITVSDLETINNIGRIVNNLSDMKRYLGENMRLIDADALKLSDFQDFSNTDVMSAIDDAPTIDAVIFPCKVGDTINQFGWMDGKYKITSDIITRVVQTKKGFTIYTKKVFYPIKTEEYDIAPINQCPYALADYYIGTREAAEEVIKKYECQ